MQDGGPAILSRLDCSLRMRDVPINEKGSLAAFNKFEGIQSV